MKEKLVNKVSWFASIVGLLMWISYIDQIRLNFTGQTGSILLPVVATINCIAWVSYGALKEKKDWPMIVSNTPGIILGIITAITAVIFG